MIIRTDLQLKEKIQWETRFYCVKRLDSLPNAESVTCSYTVNHKQYVNSGMQRRNEQNMYVFQYSLQGFGALKVKDQIYRIPEKSGFLVNVSNPDISYYLPEENQDGWRFLFFVFRDNSLQTKSIIEEYGHVYDLTEHEYIIKNLMRFKSEKRQVIEITTGKSISMVTSLLCSLIDIASSGLNSRNAILIRKAYKFIEFNIEKPYNVAMLADDLNISPEHLSRIFANELQLSPYKLITETKIRQATMLLKETDLLIKDVARRVGYEPGSHFARAFKNEIGMSPKEFRKKGVISF